MNTQQNSESTLLRSVSRRAIFIFLIVIVLAAFVLFYLSYRWRITRPHLSEIIVGVGSELLASVVFAILYAWLVEHQKIGLVTHAVLQKTQMLFGQFETTHNANLQQLTNETRRQIDDVIRSYYSEISLHFRQMIPQNYFAPTDSPDPRFHEAITEALERSRNYYFRGVTGRHVAARLESSKGHELDCRVSLLDPRKDELLLLYVRDRFGGGVASGTEKARRLLEVKEEIYSAVVSLFDIASRGSIEISFHLGPVFYRSEIFDDCMLVSFYIGGLPTAYPPTYLYRNDTFYYDAFLKDFRQAREISTTAITFNVNSNETELEEFLKTIGSDSAVSSLRAASRTFKDNWVRTTGAKNNRGA